MTNPFHSTGENRLRQVSIIEKIRGNEGNVENRRDTLTAELRKVEAELARMIAAIAAGADLPTLVEAIKERETQRTRIQEQITALGQQAQLATLDVTKVQAELRGFSRTGESSSPSAWFSRGRFCGSLLVDKLVFTPKEDETGKYLRVHWAGNAGAAPSGGRPFLVSKGLGVPRGICTLAAADLTLKSKGWLLRLSNRRCNESWCWRLYEDSCLH